MSKQQVIINDTIRTIPFKNNKEKFDIVADLQNKRKQGVKIHDIEVDDRSESVLYAYKELRNIYSFR